MKKIAAEFFGTFMLVLGGCGSAVLAGHHIGFAGVALAFGLTVLTMAFAVGPISGGHFNPAVTVGMAVGGRFSWLDLPGYVAAQVAGATTAAGIIYLIASGTADFSLANGFAANGYGAHSPDGYGMTAALICEMTLTAMFIIIILGSTDIRSHPAFAPIAIGLALTLIHLISIPVTNTSVNPARSTSQALFVGGWALEQLWLFWLAPIVGGAIGALLYNTLLKQE